MLLNLLMVFTVTVVSVSNRAHALPLDTFKLADARSADAKNLTRGAPVAIKLDLSPIISGNQILGYTTAVRIGQNPDDFNVLVDTGSSTFWVINEDAPQRGTHNTIGPGSSPSMRLFTDDRPWSIVYGDGAGVAGLQGVDNVNIGGAVVNGLRFGVVDYLLPLTADDVEDGTMGLGRGAGTRIGQPTVVETLAARNIIPAAITGWAIGRRDSQVLFGGIDQDKFTGELHRVPMQAPRDPTRQSADDGNIRLMISEVAIGSSVVIPSSRIGALDTGSSAIYTTAADAALLIAQIPGSVITEDLGELIPCANTTPLSLKIDGVFYTLDAQDIVGPPVPEWEVPGFCSSNIIGDMAPHQDWLVGIPFFQSLLYSRRCVGQVFPTTDDAEDSNRKTPTLTASTLTFPQDVRLVDGHRRLRLCSMHPSSLPSEPRIYAKLYCPPKTVWGWSYRALRVVLNQQLPPDTHPGPPRSRTEMHHVSVVTAPCHTQQQLSHVATTVCPHHRRPSASIAPRRTRSTSEPRSSSGLATARRASAAKPESKTTKTTKSTNTMARYVSSPA
ncbi:hypothetical protein EVG20_g4561 [Dentipellis fragilis]|uniref:Peptidase A1 domain-containing protein n=1 Tax=Dentipellis fragilis TaxID=205917 RepID=A0A4Y9YVE2_9AGAM|nr:hypothetical protein EVG20_g4561 [Dentipellis fragilis]